MWQLDRTDKKTDRQNANSTRQLLQKSFPSSTQRDPNMHDKTRQPNTTRKMADTNKKDKTSAQNYGQE